MLLYMFSVCFTILIFLDPFVIIFSNIVLYCIILGKIQNWLHILGKPNTPEYCKPDTDTQYNRSGLSTGLQPLRGRCPKSSLRPQIRPHRPQSSVVRLQIRPDGYLSLEQVVQGQYVVSDTRCPALSDCELE